MTRYNIHCVITIASIFSYIKHTSSVHISRLLHPAIQAFSILNLCYWDHDVWAVGYIAAPQGYYPFPQRAHLANDWNPEKKKDFEWKVFLQKYSVHILIISKNKQLNNLTLALVPGLFLRKIVEPSAIFIFDINNYCENDNWSRWQLTIIQSGLPTKR